LACDAFSSGTVHAEVHAGAGLAAFRASAWSIACLLRTQSAICCCRRHA
jgi:hypothetical protein